MKCYRNWTNHWIFIIIIKMKMNCVTLRNRKSSKYLYICDNNGLIRFFKSFYKFGTAHISGVNSFEIVFEFPELFKAVRIIQYRPCSFVTQLCLQKNTREKKMCKTNKCVYLLPVHIYESYKHKSGVRDLSMLTMTLYFDKRREVYTELEHSRISQSRSKCNNNFLCKHAICLTL